MNDDDDDDDTNEWNKLNFPSSPLVFPTEMNKRKAGTSRVWADPKRIWQVIRTQL